MTTRAIDLATGQPWAIEPAALETILQVAQRTNDAPEAVAAKLGRPLENTRQVRERDATAIIPITGPIFRRANLLTEISGATSVEVLARDLQTAADNPAINRIILEIDSPGGQATGIAELAGQIRAIGQSKPVIAYVDGMAASAAYWIASAANEIVADKTALLGSIGVIASYKPEKDGPIKVISSVSPLKQATPDTEDGRAEMQRIVDELAAVFINDIAAYRDRDPDQVASDFGRGGVLVGQAAVAVGMADRLGSFETLFTTAGTAGQQPKGIFMSYQADVNAALELPAEASAEQAVAAIQAQASKLTATHESGIKAGATQERERVSAILEATAGKPYADKTARTAIAKGLDAETAQAMIDCLEPPAAQPNADAERIAFRNAFRADADQQADDASSATGEPEAPDPETSAKAKWDSNAELRAEFGTFERYQAFQQANANGRVRILRAKRAESLQTA